MPSLVIVSQFAQFTTTMHTICSTVNITTYPQGKCYNMSQRHLAHEICNCGKIRCTLHLATYTGFGMHITMVYVYFHNICSTIGLKRLALPCLGPLAPRGAVGARHDGLPSSLHSYRLIVCHSLSLSDPIL